MRFYLGTHEVSWLGMTTVPLFISRVRLERTKAPRALGPWALDSGGFTALDRSPHRWVLEPDDYAAMVADYAEQIGGLMWAAPQDWMCEPQIVAKTGLSVREHQERTVQNYLDLRGKGPFIPVLQGWNEADYHHCIDLFEQAGVDLAAEPIVGLGTVCRRQATAEIRRVVSSLTEYGLRLHGFGMKSRGLHACGHLLTSADSMAWSFRARQAWYHDSVQLGGPCDHRGSCANCMGWAMRWRQRVVDGLGLFAEVVPDNEAVAADAA